MASTQPTLEQIQRWLQAVMTHPAGVAAGIESDEARQQIEWADRLFGAQRHSFVGLVSTAVGALTSFLPLRADNAALRAADRADRRIERSALRYWMRLAVLAWEKG